MDTQLEQAVERYGVRGLARELGMSPAYVSMLARGQRALTEHVTEAVAELVNTPSVHKGVHKSADRVLTARGGGGGARLDGHVAAVGDPPRFRTENLLIKSQLLYH